MTRRIHAWGYLFLVPVILGACGRSPVPTSATVSTESSAKAPVASDSDASRHNLPAAPESDSDPTFYLEEYEARSVPPIQNPWTAKDYAVATAACGLIAKENPAHLPRLNSKRSGAVFRRIISKENLLVYTDRNIDLNTRRMHLQSVLQSTLGMLLIYSRALTMGQPVDREVLEMFIQQAHVMRAIWVFFDEDSAAIYAQDAGYQSRMAHVELMREGTAGGVSGMLGALTDRELLGMANLIWYADELVSILPSLINRMTPARQAEAKERIAQFVASEPEPALAKQLKRLAKAVSTPASTAAP